MFPGMHQPGPVVACFLKLPTITHNSDEANSWFLQLLALFHLTPESEKNKLLQPC